MKLETIKKDKKKKIIIGSMIVLSVVGCLTLTATRAKYKTIQSLKIANGIVDYKAPDLKLAIKVSEDGETYISQADIPTGNYTLNIEKSKCRIPDSSLNGENAPVDESIAIEYADGKLNFRGLTKNNTKCYIYFDKKLTTPSQDTLAKLNVQNIKEGIPDFTQVATGAETEANNGIFVTDDPMYGENAKTYYWRGAATTNHVIFDNKCWRIVRINGDGSIRLIYNGEVQSGNACKGNGSWDGNVVLKNTAYNVTANNSKYVGWTYATTDIQRPTTTRTDGVQDSGEPASLKTALESWYSTNISESRKKHIAKGYFCNNRDVSESWWNATGVTQYYAVCLRLWYDFNPTLSCSDGDIYQLDVGMITADEAQFAGVSGRTNNHSYYLYNGQDYWTISPALWNSDYLSVYVHIVGYNGNIGNANVNYTNAGVRPVINLRSDVTFNEGADGTQNNPYIVQ